MKIRALAAGFALLSAVPAFSAPFPLAASAGATPENSAPFVLSDGLTQSPITNRNALNAKGLPATFSTWDMSAFDKNSKHIFTPAETGTGAGVFRYNLKKGGLKVLLKGNNTGVRTANPALFDPLNDDFARLDPATYTPMKTIITGEETTGGSFFEIKNPSTNGSPSLDG